MLFEVLDLPDDWHDQMMMEVACSAYSRRCVTYLPVAATADRGQRLVRDFPDFVRRIDRMLKERLPGLVP